MSRVPGETSESGLLVAAAVWEFGATAGGAEAMISRMHVEVRVEVDVIMPVLGWPLGEAGRGYCGSACMENGRNGGRAQRSLGS